MIVLGVDPSLTSSGVAILEVNEDELNNLKNPCDETLFDINNDYTPELVYYSVFRTKSCDRLCERNLIQRKMMKDLIKKYKPDLMVCEDQFGHLNIKTLKKLSHVRGNFMSLAADYDLPFYLFSPMGMKKVITGKGNCGKDKVIKAVNKYFNKKLRVKGNKAQDNEADAIGLALSYLIEPKKPKSI